MTRLVVLIEGVGTPEHTIAVGTRVLLVTLVKLILMSLPVKLPLEFGVTTKSLVSKGRLRVPGLWQLALCRHRQDVKRPGKTHEVHQ